MTQLSDRNIIIGLVLLQLAVCLPFINSFPIALDEPFSIFWAQQDLGEMISQINKGNNSPLHFILLNGWIKMFGISPLSVRLLSMIFSLLTIIFIYLLARKLLSQWFSVFAVFLFVFSKFDHFHAMEARMYALFLLLFTMSLLWNYEIIFEKRNRYFALVLVNVAMLYTHYLAIFCIGSQALIFILNYQLTGRRSVFKYLVSLIVTGLLFLPGLLIFIERIVQQSASVSWVPAPHVTELYGNILRFFNGTLTFFIFFLSILLLVFYKFKKRFGQFFAKVFKPPGRFILLAFFIPYLGIYLYSIIFTPIFLDRYLLFTTIPLFIALAYILSNATPLNKEWVVIGIMTIIMACGVSFKPENNRAPDEVAAYVKSELTENCKIVITPPYYDLTFLYHFDQKLFKDWVSFPGESDFNKIQPIYSFDEVKDANDYSRIILVDDNSQFVYPGNEIKLKLEAWGNLVEENVFKGGTSVHVFSRK